MGNRVKALVTGGAGFIGSHVVDGLIDAGHEVVVVDNLSTGYKRNLNPQARFYEVDIRDTSLCDIIAEERPDIINHHAAQSTVLGGIASPRLDADINIMGSLNLLHCVRDSGVKKIIYASTGGALYGEPEYLPCDENHPIRPLSAYGISKYIVEHYIRFFAGSEGIDYTILRYPNVYGPRQEAGVIAIFGRQMLSGEQPIIYGTGEQERDFVYIADIVRANLLALTRGSGEVHNLGSGESISINELFATMKAKLACRQDAIQKPLRMREPVKMRLDISKAGLELGWYPTTSLLAGLERTIRCE